MGVLEVKELMAFKVVPFIAQTAKNIDFSFDYGQNLVDLNYLN